ncbi:AraC family transcriptional regulator [Rhizobium sp. L1K21]|uniref:AraC family transcriptional regulator n=1 Tax=Rhizobium sp. L1K21 TaxID=2954933 RepID=UPI0035948C58
MIAPGFVEDALESLRRSGIDPTPVLNSVNIEADPLGPVTSLQYGQLWLAIATLSGDEFFGLAAHPMRPGAFRSLCYTVVHAGTMERALRRALIFLNIVLDDPSGEFRQVGGQTEIILTDLGEPRSAFAYRTYWLILLGVLSWLVGRRIHLSRVDFSCPAPTNRQEYHQFFGAPVHFDQPTSRITFRASYLKLPLIRDEKALKHFLRGAPANILLRYSHDQGYTAGVRHRLLSTQPDSWPTFETVAAGMNISPATLRRRLKSEGQSFAAIRDDIRMTEAQRLLRQSHESVARIASLLGYTEPSAFHRAFQKWSGMTPLTFRRQERLSGVARPSED